MFFGNTSKSSSPDGEAPSLPNSAESTGTSATAARPHAERVWNSAISARTERCGSTRAAIATVRGVSRAPEIAG